MAICLNPQCRHVNADDSKFCVKCGSALLLLQHYRALQILGQGGFGITYLAQDEAKPSKPRCVIKEFYSPLNPDSPKALEMFKAEAVQLDKLGKHSQIPELYAHCQQNGRQFLVQEFIDGQDLEKELKAKGAFPEAKIRALLLDLLPVLEFIHQHQVIHRDIKPPNIMRRSDGKLVLIDFGAAKQVTLTALQRPGTCIHSEEYTAPEQMQGRAVYASDLYSLGVTCICLLTGEDPSKLQNLDGTWVWRDFLGGNTVGAELGAVLDRMLLPVSQRYSSAAEVLDALNPPQPSQKAKALQKGRSLWTAAFGGILLLGAAMMLYQQLPLRLFPPSPPTATVDPPAPIPKSEPEPIPEPSPTPPTVVPPPTLEPQPVTPEPIPEKTASEFFDDGLKKQNSGDYQGAIADYNQAIQLEPDYAEAYNNRGNAKSALGDKQGAIIDYDESIRLNNPELYIPYHNRGLAKSNLGDNQGAIADYTEAIRLKPDYADAYHNRGLAKSNLGDYQGAIADYTEAIRLRDTNTNLGNSYYNRGTIYKQRGELRKALVDFWKAAELYQKQGNTEMHNSSREQIRELGG